MLRYYVNLNERGSFYADVRDESGETVFEVRAGDALDADESDLVPDVVDTNPHSLAKYAAECNEARNA